MKLNARVLQAAHGTEVFLTTPLIKDPKNPDGPMVTDPSAMQVNTVLRLPADAGFESGMYDASITLTPVGEPKQSPVKTAEEAKKS